MRTRLGDNIDVAINYYGKPYQTALTIATLLEHSAEWVESIYLVARDILVTNYGLSAATE